MTRQQHRSLIAGLLVDSDHALSGLEQEAIAISVETLRQFSRGALDRHEKQLLKRLGYDLAIGNPTHAGMRLARGVE